MSQTVVDIPGLPDGVEVRRSTRRRRSVTAFREDGRTVVVVPHRMSRAEIVPYVEELVGRLAAREGRGRRTDGDADRRTGTRVRRPRARSARGPRRTPSAPGVHRAVVPRAPCVTGVR